MASGEVIAVKLEEKADAIDSVIDNYKLALDEISKNQSTSATKYKKEINNYIKDLTDNRKKLMSVAKTIRKKTAELKKKEQ